MNNPPYENALRDDESRTDQEATTSSSNSGDGDDDGGGGSSSSSSANKTAQRVGFCLSTSGSGSGRGGGAYGGGEAADNDDMKRAAARKLIERYFYQLIDGCGNPNCSNKFCASSGEIKNLSRNQAAAQALQLFSQEALLCERHPNKIARTQGGGNNESGAGGGGCGVVSGDGDSATTLRVAAHEHDNNSGPAAPNNSNCCSSSSSSTSSGSDSDNNMGLPSNDISVPFASESKAKSQIETIPFLTEQKLLDIIDECEQSKNYSKLIRTLGENFNSINSLCRSFLLSSPASTPNSELGSDKSSGDAVSCLRKEDLRSMEGEPDKDEDSSGCGTSASDSVLSEHRRRSRLGVDLASVRRTYSALFKIPCAIFESALVTALVSLAGYLQIELQRRTDAYDQHDILNVLVIVFEIPALGSGDFLETAFPALCRAVNWLPTQIQAQMAHVWSGPVGRSSLRVLLENLQQLITLRVILTQYQPDFFIQDETIVMSATKLMKVLYYANILAGEMDSPDLREDDLHRNHPAPDTLALELGINALDSRKPYLALTEFYNEPLSENVEMDKDFANYKSESGNFCFMYYSFILTPATKTLGLYFDNRIRMYSERRMSYFQSVTGQPSNPYLRLKVRRDHIIDDALVELEMIEMENPIDLKKQLVVEFEGEQGIDEGGVSKEFFQLVVEEIFNPDYAMFICHEGSQTVWFNPTGFETDGQFTLIGIVLGLAIYNNIILSVNFPMVLYRKLMGKKGAFADLEDWNPTLYNSLKQMLEYSDDDLEDVFMQSFRISYQDVFGTLHSHDLCADGDNVAVTQANKKEFVDAYADYLLNVSVEKQFRAFSKGFQMVTDESPLELLFRPEELELLICGSKEFDFNQLEVATEYDGGYTKDTGVVKHFWAIVHSLSTEDQRRLLQFTTGSDRVPLGGLSKLKLVIARNGPDSNRLPTAHTCFNVLLLPEYDTFDKLKDRLLKAISYSKGFGML